MTEIVYYLSKSYLYLVLFPIFAIILAGILYIKFKKSVKNNNISLYGMFLSLNRKDILSLTLVLLEYIIVLESMFITKFSYFSILYIFTPILIYAIINMDIISMIVNIIGASFLLVMNFFERVFLSYILYVDKVWYVIVLFIAVCVLMFVINTYILMRNINEIVKKRVNKEKVKIMAGEKNE